MCDHTDQRQQQTEFAEKAKKQNKEHMEQMLPGATRLADNTLSDLLTLLK